MSTTICINFQVMSFNFQVMCMCLHVQVHELQVHVILKATPVKNKKSL